MSVNYIDLMLMLRNNILDDILMLERIELARIECGSDQDLQYQLDIKEASIKEAQNRGLHRMAEIASLN